MLLLEPPPLLPANFRPLPIPTHGEKLHYELRTMLHSRQTNFIKLKEGGAGSRTSGPLEHFHLLRGGGAAFTKKLKNINTKGKSARGKENGFSLARRVLRDFSNHVSVNKTFLSVFPRMKITHSHYELTRINAVVE